MATVGTDHISLRDIVEVAQDPAIRTALTPFGGTAGHPQRYVGRAVSWKGMRFPDRATAVRELGKINANLGAGLAAAGKIADGCRGVHGKATLPNGVIVPSRARCMYDSGKHGGGRKGRKAAAAAE